MYVLPNWNLTPLSRVCQKTLFLPKFIPKLGMCSNICKNASGKFSEFSEPICVQASHFDYTKEILKNTKEKLALDHIEYFCTKTNYI